MFPAIAIPKFDKARNIPLQPPKIQPGLPFCGQSRFRTLTKYRKNEAFIRNDGVYVISGIFCGAHEARALWAKQRIVSPVSNESCKRACERCRSTIANCGCKCLHLRRKIHSRPDCWPSKPAKRCVDKQSGNLARKPQVCGRSERHRLRQRRSISFAYLSGGFPEEALSLSPTAPPG